MIQAGDSTSGAIFSDCERYRYLLWRRWDESKPKCNFLMLNPSKATHLISDNTVTRARIFSETWGYGALVVTNLFALRSTDPEELYKIDDPVGAENDHYIEQAALSAGMVICAWGQHGRYRNRGMLVRSKLASASIQLHYLRMGAKNQPWHPLYLPSNLKPKEWTP